MIVIDALRGPTWLAVKVTVKVQFAPAARLEPHVLVWLKSVALVPVSAMLLIATAKAPVLVTVSVCEVLEVPMSCGAKLRLAGERVSVSGSRSMETVYACEADRLAESVTFTVNATACAAVSGVPEIMAVLVVLLLSARL